ncbi:MAG: HNH endonuclease [Ferruginibacter sp.]
MTKDQPGEQWKSIKPDFEFVNDLQLEISNFGRLRSFSKISKGNLINGSMINGYRIIRIKLFKARDEKRQKEINRLRLQVTKLSKHVETITSKRLQTSTRIELEELKEKLAIKVKTDEKARTIYYHSLIHRLVAQYFMKPPTANQTVVAHLDFDKLNNRKINLVWMTAEENYAHQKNSPYVIKEKNDRMRTPGNHTTKLTITKVMLLKKLLNQNKPIKQLAKQFRVTDTQIIRIKKGENWAGIEAAK